MEKFKMIVTMEYETEVEIEAETLEEAIQDAKDRAGDGILLRDAELTDLTVDY